MHPFLLTISLTILALVLLTRDVAAAVSAPIVFPADAVVVNVKDAGVKGDGVSDDTAGLNAVFKKFCGTMGVISIPPIRTPEWDACLLSSTKAVAFSLITCTLWAHKNAVQDTVDGTTKTQADSGRYWNYVYLPGTKPL